MFSPAKNALYAERESDLSATIGDITPEGIPYLVPEIQLLYKAKGRRLKDEVDFRHTVPVLPGERRAWLRDALLQVHPQHPWLDHLTDG